MRTWSSLLVHMKYDVINRIDFDKDDNLYMQIICEMFVLIMSRLFEKITRKSNLTVDNYQRS